MIVQRERLTGMQTPSAWRLAPAEPPPIRDWGGDFIVYNPLSGDTHILDIAAGETLKMLSAGTAPEEEICEHIAAFLEIPNDALLADNVSGILARLDELGLIEPANACE